MTLEPRHVDALEVRRKLRVAEHPLVKVAYDRAYSRPTANSVVVADGPASRLFSHGAARPFPQKVNVADCLPCLAHQRKSERLVIHPLNARLSRFRHAFLRDLWLFTLAAIVLLCGCGIATPAATSTVPPSVGASPGSAAPDVSTSPSQSSSLSSAARIVSIRHVADRTEDLTISSPAVGDEVKVRLLLPTSYKTDKARRWPVLYLLHGCCDSYVSWSRSTDIAQLTKDSDVLVAMPDGGPVGFYSDWRAGPRWETFHTTELPRLLAQHYRASTVAAVAGVSMGGLGALDYAARHPGMFTVAASFSGIVHTRLSSDESQGYLGLVQSQGAGSAGPLG